MMAECSGVVQFVRATNDKKAGFMRQT